MGLETVTHISDLNTAWPIGSTDLKQDGDNHIRNIKVALKTDFPNITGPVTLTQAQINEAARLSASNVFTGSNQFFHGATDSRIYLGDLAAGSGLVYFYLSSDGGVLSIATANDGGSGIANAMQITKNAASAVTAFSIAPALALSAITLGGIAANDFSRLSQSNTYTNAAQGITAASAAWSINDGGTLAAFTASYVGAISNVAYSVRTNNTARLTVSAAGDFDFKGGLVTTNCASAQEVGTRGPQTRGVSASGNTAATDCGNSITFTGGSGQTFTLDADPPINSVVILVNESGNPWTIAASGSLIFGGVTGSRTLPNGCMAAAYHRQGSGIWQIAGQLT